MTQTHELRYDSDTDCVILRVEGTVNLDRIRKLAPEVASLCERKECFRVLNDMSMAAIDISILDAYESPTVMVESGITQRIKRALVLPPSFDKSDFLEIVTRNRGHDFMVFTDIHKARLWLLE
jgi:hypothetical protein